MTIEIEELFLGAVVIAAVCGTLMWRFYSRRKELPKANRRWTGNLFEGSKKGSLIVGSIPVGLGFSLAFVASNIVPWLSELQQRADYYQLAMPVSSVQLIQSLAYCPVMLFLTSIVLLIANGSIHRWRRFTAVTAIFILVAGIVLLAVAWNCASTLLISMQALVG